MRFVITVDDSDDEMVALQTRYFLTGVVRINRWLMRKHGSRIPPLYESGLRFRTEPWANDVQHCANCLEALERGWIDCKVAVCYRLAELQNAAPSPREAARYGMKIYWRVHDTDALHGALAQPPGRKLHVHHVQVRHPDKSIEDPSRLLHQ